MINTIQMIMAIHKKEFRVNEYVHAFEKSLNYIFGAIIAIGFVSLVWYISVYPDWMKKIPQVLSDIHNDPTEVLCVITAVLTTLPYYFYYVLKDNTYWNGYNGKKDNWGLLKIFIIYEICIVSFFYLLL